MNNLSTNRNNYFYSWTDSCALFIFVSKTRKKLASLGDEGDEAIRVKDYSFHQ